MAPDEAPPEEVQTVAQMPLPRRVAYWAFAALVVLAAVFYFAWGFSFGVWLDNGVYALVITLVGFGLGGMWLISPTPHRPIPSDRR